MANINLVNPVPYHVLETYFSEVGHPDRKIKYLRKTGRIHPIMKGWYLLDPNPDNYSPYLLANLLYGPSYVSGLTALSYYGLIEDATVQYQSMVFKRGKFLTTSVGTFSYHHIPAAIFSLGVSQIQYTQEIRFLMAEPTKALYDHLLITQDLKITGKKELLTYLEYDLRFDVENLSALNTKLLTHLSKYGRKKRLTGILLNLVISV